MNRTHEAIERSERYGARNYAPLPIVAAKAEGVWVEDPEGNRYLDMLSAYSALNQGHRHPRIIQALKEQADLVTLTSRAYHNERLGELCERLAAYTGQERVLVMNTGSEAVETALKAVRRWAYRCKGVPADEAEIIVCEGNFHGRTITITSFSSEEAYKSGFGPFTPGFRPVPYGDLAALAEAITPKTAALLIEPIQGEAGVVVPPAGYLAAAAKLCAERNVLFVADEIQTGFGRTGRRFACDREGVVPDVLVAGKALGGGVLPISAVAAREEVLGLFEPGSHGSTFGGNPLACAVAIAAIDVIEEERLAERAERLGAYMLGRLAAIGAASPYVRDVRGRGLLLGVELDRAARPFCERLLALGVIAKETHERTIRFAPPLVVAEAELDWALERIEAALAGEGEAGQGQ